MQERLVELNEKWKQEDRITIETGIGINTGTCIIGNIGSKRRVNYTLISDTVNATARLGTCKQYKDNVLISSATYERIKDQLNCEFIDNVHVKGKRSIIHLRTKGGHMKKIIILLLFALSFRLFQAQCMYFLIKT